MTEDEQNQDNRRQFSRIPFDIDATLASDTSSWNTKLIDISLKGALVECPDDWEYQPDSKQTLRIVLGITEPSITMETIVSHVDNKHIGLCCLLIDDESIMHLKRLVELNLGDPELMNRELSALIKNIKSQER